MQRINLFPNPDFQPGGTVVIMNLVAATMQDESLNVTAQSTSMNSYAMMIVRSITPGSQLRFSFTENSGLDDDYALAVISNSSWSELAKVMRDGGEPLVSAPFIAPNDGVLRILFYPYRHDGAADAAGTHVFTRPQLELASTYTSNEHGGGAFFSGSTMPLD